jgi:hypothetical protein
LLWQAAATAVVAVDAVILLNVCVCMCVCYKGGGRREGREGCYSMRTTVKLKVSVAIVV